MTELKGPGIGAAAASVAKAANVSALLQAMAVGALPDEAIMGLLVAAETAILVQIAVGGLSREDAEGLRRRAVAWSQETAKRMEEDGTADAIRENHAKALEAFHGGTEDSGGEDGKGSGDTNLN